MSTPGQVPQASPVVRPATRAQPPAPSWRARALRAGLLLWPVAELAVLIEAGSHLGAGGILLALLAGVVAGSLVLRAVATAAIRRPAGQGSPGAGGAPAVATVLPGRPGAETALVVLAGVLLILPGFLSDVAALVLLLPPLRRRLGRRVGAAVMRRFPARSVRVVQGQVLH